MTLLKNCRLVPELTEGYTGDTADILVKNGLIEEILPCGAPVPGGAEVIDLAGATLLPGLIDLHVHLVTWSGSAPYEALTIHPGDLVFKYYAYAMAMADQGYTTVRDVGSDGRCVLPLAKAIDKGLIPGPRLIGCGLIVTPTETGNDSFRGMYNEANGPDDFMRACREEYKYGAKFIKLMASGAFLNEGGTPAQPIITPEEMQVAVDVSRNKDGYVAAHCHSKEAIMMAVDTGVRTIEHGSFIDDECIEAIKARGDCFIVPTLSTLIFYDNNPNSAAYIQAASHKLQLKLQTFNHLKAGWEKGLKYGWGTDIPMENWVAVPGYEFTQRKKYLGCDNLDLLKQATIYSAEIGGIDHLTGSVKVGKCADLVAVAGDPVADIQVMTQKPLHVWCRGVKTR